MRSAFSSIKGLRPQQGIGLIELLVSMFIGLFIMAGVVQMVGTTSQNAISTNGISRIQENARFAFSRMEDDLMRTGNMGCTNTSLAVESTVASYDGTYQDQASVLDDQIVAVKSLLGAQQGVNDLFDYDAFIGGVDNLPMNSNLGIEGTDSFIVRFTDKSARVRVATYETDNNFLTVVDADRLAAIDIQQHQIVLVGHCNRAVVFMVEGIDGNRVIWDQNPSDTSLNNGQFNFSVNLGDDVDSNNEKAEPFHLYAGTTGAYRYFIDDSIAGGAGSCDPNDDVDMRNCSLFRTVNGESFEVVEGVHNLQVSYGYYQGDDLFFADATQIGNDRTIWNAIDRVNITLSLNSIEPVALQGNAEGQVIEKEFTRTISLFNQLNN